MSDQFTEVTTTGWGSRIINSIKGVLVGFLMFIISFGVLYWNEGKVDLSKIAETAIMIDSYTQAQVEANNQLVFTTGVLKSDEMIGDTFLQSGNYISLNRNVEMYAWEEEKQTESEKNIGGSETTKTTYNYKKEWTSSPSNSSNFRIQEEHINPQMSINSNSVKVSKAKLGIYDLDMNQVTLPPDRNIALNNNIVIPNDGFTLASDQYLFKGNGTVSTPQIGDIRISYLVLHNPLDTATIFGKLDISNNKISPYYGTNNSMLYRIFEGTRDGAISTMKTEYKMFLWIFRLVGLALMWIGLMTLFGPISVFLDVLPIFGSISRTGIGLITFIVSLVLSIITIIVSMLIHNLMALIIVIIVFIVGMILYMQNKKNKYLGSIQNTDTLS